MILKKQNFKGITLCLIIALPIWFVVQYFRALEIIGAPVIGMLIGMTLSIIIKNKAIYAQGINFVSKKILQYAVILLGFGLNLGTIAKAGLVSLPIIISTILSSLITAFLILRFYVSTL